MVGEMPVATVDGLVVRPGSRTTESDIGIVARVAELAGCEVSPSIIFYPEDIYLNEEDFYDTAEKFGHGIRPRIAEQAWCSLVDVHASGRDSPLNFAIAPVVDQMPESIDYSQYGDLSVRSLFSFVDQVKEEARQNSGKLPSDIYDFLPKSLKGRLFELWSAIAQYKLYECRTAKKESE